jgi:uncharacterized membrane protein YfcA
VSALGPEALGIGWDQAAAALAVYFVGGFVKGVLGFGLPLVTISVLPLIIPIDLALVTNALILPVLNAWQVRAAGRFRESVTRFWPLILALCLTMPMGAALVSIVEPQSLMAALGVAIMAFSVLNAVNPRLRIPARFERPAAIAAGTGAGIVGGITTINGPFFLIFLLGVGADRQLMLSALGLVDWARLVAALLCLVPASLGMVLGLRLARRLPVELFRRIVLGVLFLLGANIILRALGS